MIKYGVHLFLWTAKLNEHIVPLIRKAKNMGFDGVEIPLLETIDVNRTKRELEKNKIGCIGSVGLSLDKDISSIDVVTRKRGIDYLKRCVEITSELGGDSINGVIYTAWGKITGKSRTSEEWERSVEGLREVCKFADHYGVTLSVEPVNRFETYFINTAADAVKYVKEIGEPNARVHLDTFHMNIEERDFYDAVKQTGRLLNHLHCCENDRGIPGTGHVGWDGVFRALSEIGYDKWLVIESFVPDMGELSASTAIWRKVAPSSDAIAYEGLKFLRKMAEKYL